MKHEDFKYEFSGANGDSNAYEQFLHLGYKYKNIDSGIIVSYNDFRRVCPLFCFDVSNHKSNIYRSGSTADTKIKLLLGQVPANPYNNHCVIFSERKTLIDNKLYVNI